MLKGKQHTVIEDDSALINDETTFQKLSESFLKSEKALIEFASGMNVACSRTTVLTSAEQISMASLDINSEADFIFPSQAEAGFIFPSQAEVELNNIALRPGFAKFQNGDTTFKFRAPWEKSLRLYLKAFHGNILSNRRLLVKAQRAHWKKLKGGIV